MSEEGDFCGKQSCLGTVAKKVGCMQCVQYLGDIDFIFFGCL
jgi:hypothetical protein